METGVDEALIDLEDQVLRESVLKTQYCESFLASWEKGRFSDGDYDWNQEWGVLCTVAWCTLVTIFSSIRWGLWFLWVRVLYSILQDREMEVLRELS